MRVCPVCRGVYGEQDVSCAKDNSPLIDRSQSSTYLNEDLTPTLPGLQESVVRPGLMIGEYQVESVVAEGGMGVVYAGVHPLIRKRVAIKVLHKRYAEDPNAIARFVLEARSVNEIGHHNIVDIFSIGELEDRRNYLIMEYLDGLPLHTLLMRVGRLQPEELLPIYEQLCDALKLAHAKQFIHRDLKPHNILVVRRPPYPFIKILDFGLAKLRTSITSTNTAVGTVIGTPEYMAPEQCRGELVDARTDTYALGVMLYELVTGRRPFTDASPYRVLAMQQRDTPVPPSQYVSVPEALEMVILRAIAKQPHRRYPSADELLGALRVAIPQRTAWTIDLTLTEASTIKTQTALNKAEATSSVRWALLEPDQPSAVPQPAAILDSSADDSPYRDDDDSDPNAGGHARSNSEVAALLRRVRQKESAQEPTSITSACSTSVESLRGYRERKASSLTQQQRPTSNNPGGIGAANSQRIDGSTEPDSIGDRDSFEDRGATEISPPPNVKPRRPARSTGACGLPHPTFFDHTPLDDRQGPLTTHGTPPHSGIEDEPTISEPLRPQFSAAPRSAADTPSSADSGRRVRGPMPGEPVTFDSVPEFGEVITEDTAETASDLLVDRSAPHRSALCCSPRCTIHDTEGSSSAPHGPLRHLPTTPNGLIRAGQRPSMQPVDAHVHRADRPGDVTMGDVPTPPLHRSAEAAQSSGPRGAGNSEVNVGAVGSGDPAAHRHSSRLTRQSRQSTTGQTSLSGRGSDARRPAVIAQRGGTGQVLRSNPTVKTPSRAGAVGLPSLQVGAFIVATTVLITLTITFALYAVFR